MTSGSPFTKHPTLSDFKRCFEHAADRTGQGVYMRGHDHEGGDGERRGADRSGPAQGHLAHSLGAKGMGAKGMGASAVEVAIDRAVGMAPDIVHGFSLLQVSIA